MVLAEIWRVGVVEPTLPPCSSGSRTATMSGSPSQLVLNDWCITSIALQKALLLKVNFIFRSPELSDLYFLEVIKQEFLDFPVP